MKAFQIFICSFLLTLVTITGFAQAKTEKIKVPGECGMCKKKIEAAAKKGGASYAEWDADAKTLTVKYAGASGTAKIQQAVARAGYDTPACKATDEAYNRLDACCHYERADAAKAPSCSAAQCAGDDCGKDGHGKDKSTCADACCEQKDGKKA